MAHRAKKRFGQNFLNDLYIIQKMVDAIQPKSTDRIVEIGPGQAALTQPILQYCHPLHVIEIDRDLVAHLKKNLPQDQLVIHEADALTFDFSVLSTHDPLRIIGNLPYNISSPLLFHLMSFRDKISDIHILLQKEVVDRITAPVGSHHYGRLSVMMQFFCRTQPLFHVPPTSFDPIPKVDSTFLRLIPHTHHSLTPKEISTLSTVVKTAFSQRRKTIRNSLQQLLPVTQLEKLSVDLSLRPQALSVNDYLSISKEIEVLLKQLPPS